MKNSDQWRNLLEETAFATNSILRDAFAPHTANFTFSRTRHMRMLKVCCGMELTRKLEVYAVEDREIKGPSIRSNLRAGQVTGNRGWGGRLGGVVGAFSTIIFIKLL